MGWGGSALAMIQTIKNNRELLKKRNSYFKAKENYLKAAHDIKLNYGSATKEQLQQVRTKIAKQQKAAKQRSIILLVILIPALCYGAYTFLGSPANNISENKIKVNQEKMERYQFFIHDGDSMLRVGKWNNAIFLYSRAQELFPREFAPQYRKALAYSYKCQYKNEDCAIGDSLVNRLLNYFPDNVDIQKLHSKFNANAYEIK